MRQRPILVFRPDLERFEAKYLLTASTLAAGSAESLLRHPSAGAHSISELSQNQTALTHAARLAAARASHQQAADSLSQQSGSKAGYTLFRITQPGPGGVVLQPPFQQVLVQTPQPIPGAVYNVLSVSVKNGTTKTFDASSGFSVKFSGQPGSFPILTGNEQWKPGQFMVFYILTKKYYPPNPVVGGGFMLNLAGSTGTAIPGPSGIFLRVKYNPATFANTLNWIVAHGPGSKGHELGLPDTALWEVTSSKNYVIPL